jgi:amino acid transporter
MNPARLLRPRAPTARPPRRDLTAAGRRRSWAKAVLFLAFAFTIMADPVSSVAYTIEASLRALHGHLGLLMATQIIVLAIILLVDVNYWELVAKFPMGGGSAEAAARAFGTGWVFVPIGALIVDFVLTITISVAAGVSALIRIRPRPGGAPDPARTGAVGDRRRAVLVRSRRTAPIRTHDAAVHHKRRGRARARLR